MSLSIRDNIIRLLAEDLSGEFAEFAAGDERVHELLMELASEFVNENIPIVDEDAANDVAVELLMSTTVKKV